MTQACVIFHINGTLVASVAVDDRVYVSASFTYPTDALHVLLQANRLLVADHDTFHP